MPRIYDVCHAKCPFFMTSGKRNVMCEGITNNCKIILDFSTEENRNKYRESFCDTLQYQKCNIYSTLIKKYESQ